MRIPWSLEDRIRWIEWRIRELTICKGNYVDDRGKWLIEKKNAEGRKFILGDQVAEYAVWLLHVRDKQSWHQLAFRFFSDATEQDIDKYELRLRRAYNRVERNHPGSSAYRPRRLSERDKLLLQAISAGVIPVYLRSR